MKVNYEYLIKAETVMLTPRYDETGCLHTVVRNRSHSSEVDISPSKLIDYNLRYLGSSLRGAIEGSTAILGRVHTNPILLAKELNIVLFPSKSPSRDDCIWFSLRHIDGTESRGPKKTEVFFVDGSTVTLEMSISSFKRKIRKACELQTMVQARQRELMGRAAE